MIELHYDLYRQGHRANPDDMPYVVRAATQELAMSAIESRPESLGAMVVIRPSSPALAPVFGGRKLKDSAVIVDYLRANDCDEEARYLAAVAEAAVFYAGLVESANGERDRANARLYRLAMFLRNVFHLPLPEDTSGEDKLSPEYLENDKLFDRFMRALENECRAGVFWNSLWHTDIACRVRKLTRLLPRLSSRMSYAGEPEGQLYEGIRSLEDVMVIKQAAPIQQRVRDWVVDCFGSAVAKHRGERVMRFLEEALELAQASGECGLKDAMQMAEYVFSRPPGEVPQEIAGTAITLMALANAWELDVGVVSESEMMRCEANSEKIADKQYGKPAIGPQPAAYADVRTPWIREDDHDQSAC